MASEKVDKKENGKKKKTTVVHPNREPERPQLCKTGGSDYALGDYRMIVNSIDKEFDVNKLISEKPDYGGFEFVDKAISFFGQRGTGKSFATRWILFLLQKRFKTGLVISGTTFNNYWQRHLPSDCVIDVQFIDEALHMALNKQSKLVDTAMKAHSEEERNNKFSKMSKEGFFIILEDWIADKQAARYSYVVDALFTTGRHFNIFVICITQYAKAVSTYVRGNLDFAFILRQNAFNQRDAICKDHMDMIEPHCATWLMDKITVDRGILVVDKTPNWTDVSEILTRFKAKEPPKQQRFDGTTGYFQIGDANWWSQYDRSRNRAPAGMFDANATVTVEDLCLKWLKE
jgi:hypothetical protein